MAAYRFSPTLFSVRGLIFKIYKELKRQDSNKPNNLVKKHTYLNKELSTKGIKKMAKKCLKKCSTSLSIREM